MFPGMPDNMVTAEAQNAPNLAFYATPVLGNIEFNMQVPGKNEVKQGPPQLPYISAESILFFSAMMNPMSSPYTVYGGSNTGQQVISGQITSQDATNTSRYQMGYQSSVG